MGKYLYDILDENDVVQDHATIDAPNQHEAWKRVQEMHKPGMVWSLVEIQAETQEKSGFSIQFSGYTKEGDEVMEWCDEEADMHCVSLNREHRGFNDIEFRFDMQVEAHALFLALCDAKSIFVSGEDED
jgi:hypothetical protein